jgi:hypothetical protein
MLQSRKAPVKGDFVTNIPLDEHGKLDPVNGPVRNRMIFWGESGSVRGGR